MAGRAEAKVGWSLAGSCARGRGRRAGAWSPGKGLDLLLSSGGAPGGLQAGRDKFRCAFGLDPACCGEKGCRAVGRREVEMRSPGTRLWWEHRGWREWTTHSGVGTDWAAEQRGEAKVTPRIGA